MPTIETDPSASPVEVEGFRFPLGVYPVEPLTPIAGYVEEFEPADGGPTFWSGDDTPVSEDWEEWPDRFMFDVVVSAERLPTLARTLLAMLPNRVFPILDVLGNDQYREVDPYIAYDAVGLDRVFEALRSFGPWLYQDGLVGFGAMSLEPFLYVFVDEHKILTIRAELELKDRIERVLGAFSVGSVPEIKGADAAAHEHRGILLLPDAEHPHRMAPEDIVDNLRRQWGLQLNIDRSANIDDDGRPLGVTCWHALVRMIDAGGDTMRFAEVWLTASNYDEAEAVAADACTGESNEDEEHPEIIQLDRVRPEVAADAIERPSVEPGTSARVLRLSWIDDQASSGDS